MYDRSIKYEPGFFSSSLVKNDLFGCAPWSSIITGSKDVLLSDTYNEEPNEACG